MLYWPKAAEALHADHFGHSFFALLQSTTAMVPEVRCSGHLGCMTFVTWLSG